MRRPLSQFLLAVVLTSAACTSLSSQNGSTGRDKTQPQKAGSVVKEDPLEVAVRNYQSRLNTLEQLLQQKLAKGQPAAPQRQAFDRLNAAHDALQARHDQLTAQGRRSELALVEALDQIDKAQDGAAKAERKVEQLAHRLATQQAEMAELRQQRAMAQTESRQIEATVKSLVKQAAATQTTLDQASTRQTQLVDQVHALREELAAARDANDSLRRAKPATAPAVRTTLPATVPNQGIQIYNQGGTVIIQQAGSAGQRPATKATATRRSRRTDRPGKTGGPTKLRRINI